MRTPTCFTSASRPSDDGSAPEDEAVAVAPVPPPVALAAADDFVVLWDNAYAVHDLGDEGDVLASVFDAANTAGTGDHVVQFASTSKITHAGAGVAFIAASTTVLNALDKHLSVFTIGPDKVNQLRHVKFLQGRLQVHMADHATIIRPKFDLVEEIFCI